MFVRSEHSGSLVSVSLEPDFVISRGKEHLVKSMVVPFAGEGHLGAVGIVVAFAIALRS